jgi:RNA polymerase sigma-54 factor
VQACDPTGIAARSVAECLLLQIAVLPASACRALAARALTEHIELIASHDMRRLSRALGATLQETREAVQCVRTLNARPGRQFDDNVARAVSPDVTVRKVRGTWTTRLNASALPRVQLNEACAVLMEKQLPRANPEMAGCLELAKWTIANVTQRLSTILEVARAIVARQPLFFEYGALAMKPLGLREIADAVRVHPSTVSRAVHDKYMATPHGVYEMRRFFARGMEHATGSASAPLALKCLLQEMIGAELTHAPISDAELARQLARQGFRIARRTVTKYRQGLGIEPAERRRCAAHEATDTA